jgi:hypothetical protein
LRRELVLTEGNEGKWIEQKEAKIAKEYEVGSSGVAGVQELQNRPLTLVHFVVRIRIPVH